jgi:O-antigen ligase
MAIAGVDRSRAALRVGIYVVLVVSPLPFGGVLPWAVLGLEIAAASLALLTAWIVYRDPAALPVAVRSLWAPGAMLLAVAVAQLIPVPASWVRALAKPTSEARDSVAAILPEALATAAPASLSPPDTLDAVLRGVALALILVATAVGFRENRQFRTLAAVIVVAASFQALYGATEVLSHHQHIFTYAKKYYLGSATGTFINRNHFAAYLAMALPFALGPLIERRSHGASGSSWRQWLLHLTEGSSLRVVLAGAAAFVMWVGVFLSYSRGGLAAAVVATVVLAAWSGAGRRAWALVAVGIVAVLFLSWQQLRAPGERFLTDAETLSSLNQRLPVWEAGSGMVAHYPWLGTGFGTFESAFAIYQPSSRMTWQHVHNDWLQTAIEGGMLAPVAVAWMLWLVGRRSIGAHRGRAGYGVSGCAVAGMAAVVFHAMLDFPLRIPAIAVLLACLAGLLCADRDDAPDVHSLVRPARIGSS